MENEILDILKKLDGKFDKLESRFDKLESRFDKLESRFDKIETKVDNLEKGQNELKSRLEKIEIKVDDLEKVQSEIRIQTKENTEILRALKYNSEEHKALIDKSNMSISYIQGDVTAIKNSVDTTNVKLKILEDATRTNCLDIAIIRQAI